MGEEGQGRAKFYCVDRAKTKFYCVARHSPSSTAWGEPGQSSTARRRGLEPEPRDSKVRKEAWLHEYKDHIIKAKEKWSVLCQ